MVGSGKKAVKPLPSVHTLIANVKDNIKGVYHVVSSEDAADSWLNFVIELIAALGSPIFRSSFSSMSKLLSCRVCGVKGIRD